MHTALLIMAAGIGSRYGGIKQLDEFGPSGEKIIDYTIYDAVRVGFDKIVFVIRRDIEKDFRESVTDRWCGRIPMEFAYQAMDRIPAGFNVPPERKKPWGTGHAILSGREMIRGPFSVVNADDFYGRSALQAIRDYLSGIRDLSNADYCLVGYRLRQTLSEHGTVARGICASDENGYLTGLVETTQIFRNERGIVHCDGEGNLNPLPMDALVSMNLWGFTPSYFRYLEEDFISFLVAQGSDPKAEFFLTTTVDRLIRSGEKRVKILSTDARWFGVTYREDRSTVEQSIRECIRTGMYPETLWD